MGRSMSVNIGQKEFSSKKAAVSYFLDKREDVRNAGVISNGIFFDEMKVLFTCYCDSCPGWELNGRLITSFLVKPEKRLVNGNWITTLCYEVQLSNKECRPFSIQEAVKVIAKSSATNDL